MAGMSGSQLIQEIRTVKPNARVILISGLVEPLVVTEASTGADVVIAKSSSEPAHLVRSIKRLMNRSVSRKPPGSQRNMRSMARAVSV
jgi:DNA-binding NarL/FixJ family response regulator